MLDPVSEYGVTLFWAWKTFFDLPALSALFKAKRGAVQLWDRVHFREIISAPYLHLLHPLARVART